MGVKLDPKLGQTLQLLRQQIRFGQVSTWGQHFLFGLLTEYEEQHAERSNQPTTKQR